jgi:hypothetical protein
MEQANTQKKCQNCNTLLTQHNIYCPNCGQKYVNKLVSLRLLLIDFFLNISSLDSKFVRTLSAIFIPSHLTKAYFEGKHERYISPVKFLLIILFFFVAMISYTFNQDDATKKISNSFLSNFYNKKLEYKLDSLKQSTLQQFNNDPKVASALDTFLRSAFPKHTEVVQDTIDFNVTFAKDKQFKISAIELLENTPEAIAEQYSSNIYLLKIAIKQSVKIFQTFAYSSKSIFEYLIKQITPLLLLMIPAYALFLKLLYLRKKRYYVEHLVFNMHINTFIILIFSLALLLFAFFPTEIWIGNILTLVMTAYIIISMKQFYQQSWIKTIFKAFIGIIGYFFTLILVSIIMLAISFILFQ